MTHGGRLRSVVAGTLALGVALTGCSAGATPDPTLVSRVQDALSAARSAQLGLELAADDRILPTTNRAMLGDMEEDLLDAARDAALTTTSTVADAEYRESALATIRDAAEAVHTAENGDPRVGAARLTHAIDELARLGRQR